MRFSRTFTSTWQTDMGAWRWHIVIALDFVWQTE